MSIRVFSHQHFIAQCPSELRTILVQQFKEYKNTGIPPSTFGRDTSYDRPQTVVAAELQHIHIKDATSKKWHLQCINIYYKKSNTALIYCPGSFDKTCYLLLSYLENAHDHYGGTEQYLRVMAEYAEAFRSKF